MKKIYLAGPTVFDVTHNERFNHLKELCDAYGVVGVSPLDNDINGAGLTKGELAKLIADANVKMIQDCDAVLADLRPFRSTVEPDSGTAFEVGYAVALGKPVACLTPFAGSSMIQVIKDSGNTLTNAVSYGDSVIVDADFGMIVEDFDSPLNLMLVNTSIGVFSSIESALLALRHSLNK